MVKVPNNSAGEVPFIVAPYTVFGGLLSSQNPFLKPSRPFGIILTRFEKKEA